VLVDGWGGVASFVVVAAAAAAAAAAMTAMHGDGRLVLLLLLLLPATAAGHPFTLLASNPAGWSEWVVVGKSVAATAMV